MKLLLACRYGFGLLQYALSVHVSMDVRGENQFSILASDEENDGDQRQKMGKKLQNKKKKSKKQKKLEQLFSAQPTKQDQNQQHHHQPVHPARRASFYQQHHNHNHNPNPDLLNQTQQPFYPHTRKQT